MIYVSEKGATISIQENFCYTPMPIEHFPNICILDITTNGETVVLPELESKYGPTHIVSLGNVVAQQTSFDFIDKLYSGRVLLKFHDADGKVRVDKPAQWFMKNSDLRCSFLIDDILYSLSIDFMDDAFSYFTYRKLTN